MLSARLEVEHRQQKAPKDNLNTQCHASHRWNYQTERIGITRRMDNGHQTPILTSRCDLPAAQVAHRMFDRWRQENFFKCLREEYALDALAEYATTPDDASREVPNPAWAALDTQLHRAHAQ